MNIELLRRIKQQILQNPELYDQDSWVNVHRKTECGTACCIAGWACQLDDIRKFKSLINEIESYKTPGFSIRGTARNLLDLTQNQDTELFIYWPASYKKRYIYANNARERAAIGAEYIDYFVKKHTGIVL